MARIAHRVTVFKPRSAASGGDTDPLVPPAGAVHSDAFKVATVPGVTGFQPYLDRVSGGSGELDLLDKQLSRGSYQVRLLDKRTGSLNAERWVTAFVADGNGIDPLPGCKVKIERALTWDPAAPDAGWSTLFTGRVSGHGLETRIFIGFDVLDLIEDLKVELFGDRPHSSITYANYAPLMPLGLPFDWGEAQGRGRLKGTIRKDASGNTCNTSPQFYLELDESDLKTRYGPNGNLITSAWPNIADPNYLKIDGRLRVRLKFLSGARAGEEGEQTFNCAWVVTGAIKVDKNGHWHLVKVYLQDLCFDAFFGTSLCLDPPADRIVIGDSDVGASVEFEIYQRFPEQVVNNFSLGFVGSGRASSAKGVGRLVISEDRPLLINDVHPVQLWKDILDGKFSLLNSDGSPGFTFPYDSTAFSTLIADTTFGTMRLPVTEIEEANDFIEREILQVFQLGYYLNELDQVVPVDLRRSAIKSVAPTAPTILTEHLLDDSKVEGGTDGEEAVTQLLVRYYREHFVPIDDDSLSGAKFPNVPVGRLDETDDLLIMQVGRWVDLGVKRHEIDARGVRFILKETQEDETRAAHARSRMEELTETTRFLRGAGKTMYRLSTRRVSGITDDVQPGTIRRLDVDELVNPATGKRGGTRVGICTEALDLGSHLQLTFEDAGRASVALAPTISSVTKSSTDPRHSVTINFTSNATNDRVEIQVAVTAKTVGTRPAETSPKWRHVASVVGSGSAQNLDLHNLSKRVWVRARTLANDDLDYLVASDWAFNSEGTEHEDLDDLPAFPAITVPTTDLSAKRAVARWINSDATLQIELFLQQASCPGTVSATTRIATLAPGTEEIELVPLVASTTYCLTGRYVDALGAGATANVQFTTTSTALIAPDPGKLVFVARGPLVQGGGEDETITPDGTKETDFDAILLAIQAEDPNFGIELQRAPDARSAFDQVWQVDADAGPTYVDETTDANSATSADWLPFPTTEAVGDYVLLGRADRFSKVVFDYAGGTAGVGGVVVWEYWNGSGWSALPGVVDGTSGFTATAADGRVLSFLLPSNWTATVINGSASLFYIRARITTVYSTNPVLDQGFIDGMPNGSSAGTFSLHRLLGPGAQEFLDYPISRNLASWWYRFRLTKAGYDPGAWSTEVVAPALPLTPIDAGDLPIKPILPKEIDDDLVTDGGDLAEGVGQEVDGSPHPIYKHAEEEVKQEADGEVAITFPAPYQNAPMIVLDPHALITFNSSLGTGGDQELRLQVVNKSATGFTARAQNVAPGTPTAQSDNFSASNLLDAEGETTEANLDPGDASGGIYNLHYRVEVTAFIDLGGSGKVTITVTVALDSNDGGGWIERAAYNYSASQTGQGTDANVWAHENKQVIVSGLGLNDDVRIRVKSVQITNTAGSLGSASFSVHGFDGTGDPDNGVTYQTSTDSVESAMPNSIHGVKYAAQEVAAT